MVYRLSSLQKVYASVLSAGYIIVSVYLAANTNMLSKGFAPYAIPLSIILFLFGVWTIKTTFDFKIIITDGSISITKGFKTEKLDFSEIEGYVKGIKHIYLKPRDESKPVIAVPFRVEKYDEILSWTKKNFNDLDAIQKANEQEEILHKEDFGHTKEERELRLARAKMVAQILGVAGAVIAVWAYLIPEPLILVWVLCIVFPILILAVLRFFNGLIRTDFSKGSAYPGVPVVFLVQLALLYRAITDYDIVDYTNLVVPVIILGILFTFLQSYNREEFSFATKEGKTVLATTFISWLLFGYGVVVFYNCFCDRAAYKTNHAQITDMYTYHGRSGTKYHIRLTSWRFGKENEVFTIKQDLYERLSIGQTLNIQIHQGKLNSTWYHFSDTD